MLYLLQNSTPDTINYMILGYVLIGGTGLFYVATLLLRQRNLKRDLDVIEQLTSDSG